MTDTVMGDVFNSCQFRGERKHTHTHNVWQECVAKDPKECDHHVQCVKLENPEAASKALIDSKIFCRRVRATHYSWFVWKDGAAVYIKM